MNYNLEILYDEKTISRKIREMADQISRDYAGKDLVLIGVLKAAVVFVADLARQISIPTQIAFVCASSYGLSTVPKEHVSIVQGIDMDIAGKHVLLVDTIADTGETLACLRKEYAARNPASIRIAVLLNKQARRKVQIPIDYIGFEIPDKFVVGYGMDYAEQYRNLPYIAAVGY